MTSLASSDRAETASRPPLALAAAAFVSNFDRFAITPMLVLIATGLGAPLAPTVTAASGYFLAYGLCQPLWGLLSDRFGRVRIMRATLLAAALAGLVSAVAPNLTALIAARIVAGACFGAVVPTTLTYVGDTVGARQRQGALSDLMVAMALGIALATAVGGVLAHLVSWRAVFATPAICAAVCSFALRGLPEPRRDPVAGLRRHLGTVLRHRWALLVFGLVFVEGMVLLGTMTFLASALEHHGVDAAVAGIATAAYGIGVGAFSRLVKALSRNKPVWLLIVIGGAHMCVGYSIVATEVNTATIVISALLLGGGWSFMHSSLQTWATSVVPQARGTTVAFFAAALFVGSAVASTAAGPLAQHGLYQLLFGLAAVVAVPLTLAAAVSRYRYQLPAV